MNATISLIGLFTLLLTACSPEAVTPQVKISLAPVGTTEVEEATRPTVEETADQEPVLLFGIGMHIEPMGTTTQGYKGGKGDYSEPEFYNRHIEDIQTVAGIVEKHDGVMTVQVQSPFTEMAVKGKNPILYDLAAAGNEIALHFHEDAHLGKNSQNVPVQKWCDVMKEEIALIKLAAASPQGQDITDIRYWSGGNLYPAVFDAAACAGLSVNSDWKNPQSQTTDDSLMGVNPWRPAGGTNGKNFNRLTTHDPDGDVIFLPEGMISRDKPKSAIKGENDMSDDEAYFKYLEQALQDSLAAAESGKVNVYHFTIHPAEFRGDPAHPFEFVDRFLTEVVDPLVASGKIKWATFGEMADAYTAWEAVHPGQDMR